MKRDLHSLAARQFDLVVVGSGIFGAFAAWDASLRGLSVALIDRADFGSATSAHSLKMIHGGIRYLQHLDLFRIRQSAAERSAFLRIAPHLVRPLPIVVPTYRGLMKGKALLRAGTATYDLLVADRNRGLSDVNRQVPSARSLRREEVLALFPGIPEADLTGGVLFYDGQMYNPPRLALNVIQSAAREGAVAANYVEMTGFVRQGDAVVGIEARDNLSDTELVIRSRFVLNAAGPYAEQILERGLNRPMEPRGVYSRDACFVVPRRFPSDVALAVQGATSDPDAKLSRGKRHLFLAPWRDHTLVGVWHLVHEGEPDDFSVGSEELEAFVTECMDAYPALDLSVGDIQMVNSGLVPFGENAPGSRNLRYGHRSRLIDHLEADGLDGLITLIGVRYTTGRWEAARALDLISQRLSKETGPCRTAQTPVFSGDVEDVAQLVKEVDEKISGRVGSAAAQALARNHGSKYTDILDLGQQDEGLLTPLGSSTTLRAEVVHAVREEMAVKLTDVVFRRTDLGTGEIPSTATLEECGSLVGSELGWSESRLRRELDEAEQVPRFWRR